MSNGSTEEYVIGAQAGFTESDFIISFNPKDLAPLSLLYYHRKKTLVSTNHKLV